MIVITAKTSHHNSCYMINFLTANFTQQTKLCKNEGESRYATLESFEQSNCWYVRIWIWVTLCIGVLVVPCLVYITSLKILHYS